MVDEAQIAKLVVIIATMTHDSCSPEDAQIIRQIIAGDLNAFAELMEKYQNHVLKIVKNHIPENFVEDAAQDIFMNIYQSLPKFKGKSPFDHWLSAVAVRTCYKFWRTIFKSRELLLSDLTEKHRVWLEETLSDPSSQSSEERGLQEEAKEILDWALDRLSAEDRMVLELIYFEGHSVKETARLLGWSAINVKVRSFRSRRKLHDQILKQLPDRREA